jgi:DNA repair protein RecO (recombination protein O)
VNKVDERVIILSKTKYSEADLILKLISAEGEVYSVIAKSALKSKKRFGGGVLEPTHYIRATLNKMSHETSERLSVLTEAQIIDDFRGLKLDYDRLESAFHFVKSVAMVAREGDLNVDVFNLLGHALKKAEISKNLPHLKLQFNLKLLHLQGVLPPDGRYAPYLQASIRESDNVKVEIEESRQIYREVEYMFNSYIGI